MSPLLTLARLAITSSARHRNRACEFWVATLINFFLVRSALRERFIMKDGRHPIGFYGYFISSRLAAISGAGRLFVA